MQPLHESITESITLSSFYLLLNNDTCIQFTPEGLEYYRRYFEIFGLNPEHINTPKRMERFLELIRPMEENRPLTSVQSASLDFIKRRFHMASDRLDYDTQFRLQGILIRHGMF